MKEKIFGYSPYKRLISLEMHSNNKENFENKGKILFEELSKKLNFVFQLTLVLSIEQLCI